MTDTQPHDPTLIPSGNTHLPLASARVDCPHGERCAGCTRLGVPYGEQLEAKRARVASALSAYAALGAAEIAPAEGAQPIEGYRTRAKWMVGEGGAIGLYDRDGGHRVVDIPGCRVVSPAIARAGQALRAALGAQPERWARPFADGGALRAVDIREVVSGGSSRALVTLVVAAERAPSAEEARPLARALRSAEPSIAGVAMNLARGDGPQVLGPETVLLDGEGEAWDEIGAGATKVTFGSFVQAHRGQASRVHERLWAEAKASAPAARRPRVLDLFGGSGAIAMSLAARGAEVVTVESFARASEAAARAARERGALVRAIAGDAEAVCSAMASEGERFDLLVVNPPRRGLSPGLREAMGALGAPRVAYVSCEPLTLARDLDHLARIGYRTVRALPLDMIPLTDEVETVAVLEKGPVPPPRVLLDAGSAVFVEKGAHEPTTPQGEYRSSLLARVRLLPGMAEAVPVHRLDVGTSGVCLFARTPADVRGWSLALAAPDAGKTYLAGVKGVTSPKGVVSRPLRDGNRSIEARTRYRRLTVHQGHSILAVRPDQGRTHQIRRHLAGLGHPLLGDERYGHAPTNRHFIERYGLDRPFLHCMRLELSHPDGGEVDVFCAPPADLPLPAGLDLSDQRGARRADRARGREGQRDTAGKNE